MGTTVKISGEATGSGPLDPSEALSRETKAKIGDPGYRGDFGLELSPLLEARRVKYVIPDACFRQVALFDRVLLWQIPTTDGDDDKVAPGSTLFAPKTVREKLLTTAPRGVVVSAGLAALDYLWANGGGLGSRVKFVRLSPWHMPVDVIAGEFMYLQVVRVGDIVAIEDLAEEEHEIRLDEERGVHELVIDGKTRPRAEPSASNEY